MTLDVTSSNYDSMGGSNEDSDTIAPLNDNHYQTPRSSLDIVATPLSTSDSEDDNFFSEVKRRDFMAALESQEATSNKRVLAICNPVSLFHKLQAFI